MMIQENFDQAWPDLMRQPGFLVYFHPDEIKEIHSLIPLVIAAGPAVSENCLNFRLPLGSFLSPRFTVIGRPAGHAGNEIWIGLYNFRLILYS